MHPWAGLAKTSTSMFTIWAQSRRTQISHSLCMCQRGIIPPGGYVAAISPLGEYGPFLRLFKRNLVIGSKTSRDLTWGLFVRHANHFGHALTYDRPFNWTLRCRFHFLRFFFGLKNKIGPSSDSLQNFRRALLWSHLFPIVWVIYFLRSIMLVLSTRLSLPRFSDGSSGKMRIKSIRKGKVDPV